MHTVASPEMVVDVSEALAKATDGMSETASRLRSTANSIARACGKPGTRATRHERLISQKADALKRMASFQEKAAERFRRLADKLVESTNMPRVCDEILVYSQFVNDQMMEEETQTRVLCDFLRYEHMISNNPARKTSEDS
jgi:peptide subunit release factor 1 (eRF1)